MRTVYALALLLASAACAAAQSTEDVTVNPVGGQVLYDPGTGQMRSLPPLLQPWQAQPIKLHAPKRHAAPPPETPSQVTSAAPVESAPPPPPVVHKPHPSRVAAAPKTLPPPRQTAATASGTLDAMGDAATQPQQMQQITMAPQPIPPAEAPKPAKPTRTASIEKPGATAGTRKDVITFAAGASDPTNAAVSAVRALAGALNSALSNGSARVQLLAYAGARGEKSSDTRRLSLKRALVVRQLLIDDGVPSERIDVRALGGTDDDGPLDRVDIYLKS